MDRHRVHGLDGAEPQRAEAQQLAAALEGGHRALAGALHDHARVAVVQAELVVVLGDQQRAADVVTPLDVLDLAGEPALHARGPVADAVGSAPVGAQQPEAAERTQRSAGGAVASGRGHLDARRDRSRSHELEAGLALVHVQRQPGHVAGASA